MTPDLGQSPRLRAVLLTLVLLFAHAEALPLPGGPFEGATWVTPAHGTSPGGSYLRFEFDVPAGLRVASAVVHVSGLGHVELSFNGVRLGHDELATGWSNYNKTCYYASHHLPGSRFQEGTNVFGAILGNGMYLVADLLPRYTKFITEPLFGPRALIFDAVYVGRDGVSRTHHIALGGIAIQEYPSTLFSVLFFLSLSCTLLFLLYCSDSVALVDGTSLRYRSGVPGEAMWFADPSGGPITVSHTYGGEDYDARLHQDHWNHPDHDPVPAWLPTAGWQGPGCALVPRIVAPMKIQQVLPAVESHAVPSGVVYDLGRNFAGWPAITVYGAIGAVVTLIGGEFYNKTTGLPDQVNASPNWYQYTLKGSNATVPETWHPRFSFYGFRWVLANITGDATMVCDRC
jgi:alpha-L-rhamnosidase